MPVKLLFIADIVGKPGRQALAMELHRLIDRYAIDAVIANGENAAGGFGLTEETAGELFGYGVHLLTSGNHIWDKKDSYDFIQREGRVIRPANYPEGAPGRGAAIIQTASGIQVAVLNIEGRVFMNALDCPFVVAAREIARLKEITPIVVVDFHAEATSEKIAMGWYLDGKASAVLGTHTHVQTADERILAEGTAYITDVGMTGSFDSVIGIRKELAVGKFLSQLPARFEVAKKDVRINGVMVELDDVTGKAITIERLSIACR
jgi:2',3'-cyclic-nucleotide 2'-phosphodiesterase